MTRSRQWYRWSVLYRDKAGRIRSIVVEATNHREALVAGQMSHPEGADFTAIKQSSRPI